MSSRDLNALKGVIDAHPVWNGRVFFPPLKKGVWTKAVNPCEDQTCMNGINTLVFPFFAAGGDVSLTLVH